MFERIKSILSAPADLALKGKESMEEKHEMNYAEEFNKFRMQQTTALLVGVQILKGQLLAATTTAGFLTDEARNYLYGQFLQMAGAVEVKRNYDNLPHS